MNTAITNDSQNVEFKNNTRKDNSVPWYIAYPSATVAGAIFNYTSANLTAKAAHKDVKKLAQYVTPEILDKTMNLPEVQRLGVTLNNVEWINLNSLVRKLKTEGKNFNNMTFTQKILYKFKKFSIDTTRQAGHNIPMGKNALYQHLTKTVHLSKQKGGAYIFHELGHAKNYSSTNSAMKTLVKMKNPILSSLITTAGFLCALIPRAEGEEADTFLGKTKNFLKDSSIGITAVGALATPLEEGIASIRGASIAKKILPKDQLKMLNKMNGKAFLAYLGVAVGSILTTYIIKKLTDTNKSGQTQNSGETNMLKNEAKLSFKA